MVKTILTFHAQRLQQIFRILDQFPEGSGTMADNTMLVWASDGGSHHRGSDDIATVIVGNAGGAVLPAGEEFHYGDQQHSLCEFWLTVARAMGHSMTSFGDGTNPCRGPLPGVLAR